MVINRGNYEEWALDYIEGTLSEEQRAAFECLLSEDREIAAQIEELRHEMPILTAEKIAFPDTATLRRGARVSPLKRLGSFASGFVAAAALVALCVMLFRNEDSLSDGVQVRRMAVVEKSNAELLEKVSDSNVVVAEALVPAVVAQQNSASAPTPKRIAAVQKPIAVESVQSIEIEESDVVLVAQEPEVTAAVAIEKIAEPGSRETFLIADAAAVASVATNFDLQAADIALREQNASMTPEIERVKSERLVSGQSRSREDGAVAARVRKTLASVIAPFDLLSPIVRYETEQESGIEIASIIRISNKEKEQTR